MYRHAAYYAPHPDQLLAELGARWLGRCALSGQRRRTPSFAGLPRATLRLHTAPASRYGWHATMKAPFKARAGLTEAAIAQAFAAFTGSHAAITLPALVLRDLGDFLALVPEQPCAALQSLAFACVRSLHALAQPLSAHELADRRRTPLSPEQDAMLLKWGYPFVGTQFRWHMTLTGSLRALPAADRQRLHAAALQWFEPVLQRPVILDAISWFVEPAAGGDLQEAQRFALAST